MSYQRATENLNKQTSNATTEVEDEEEEEVTFMEGNKNIN